MIRRNWNHGVTILAGAVVLAALGAGLLVAQGSDDEDRPPIIVHNGSLIFDGGEGSNAKTWVKDMFLGEWKPDQNEAKGVRALAVTFAGVSSPSACATSTMSGEEVLIEYRGSPTANTATVMRVHLRRRHLIGKKEPKVDPNGKEMKLLEHTTITPSPPMLVYEDNAGMGPGPSAGGGWISKVTVGTNSCAFTQPPDENARKAFRVRIQPKKQH